jgi:hypothetical protein
MNILTCTNITGSKKLSRKVSSDHMVKYIFKNDISLQMKLYNGLHCYDTKHLVQQKNALRPLLRTVSSLTL